MTTDQENHPTLQTFTMEDLRRAMDLPALLFFVAEQRAVAEFDRREAADAGLAMPTGLSPREKERFLARHPEFPYEAKVYDLAEVTDEEVVLYLLSPTPPTELFWLHRLTGPPPLERTKPWEPPKPLVVHVQTEGPEVTFWRSDAEDNPYHQRHRQLVTPTREVDEPESPEDAPTPEPARPSRRGILRRFTEGDQP